MKNLSLLTAILLAFIFSSCETGLLDEGDMNIEDGSSSTELATYDALTETVTSSSFEEIDASTDELILQFFMQDEGGHFGGRKAECAEITRDTTNSIITIDFGDGCEDRNGVLKSGKIIIEYNERLHTPGAYRILSFEDFYIDSIRVDGVRTTTNITDTTATDSLEVFQMVLEGGQLTFTDGTYITRESDMTRTVYRGGSREESYIMLTGEASGQLQDSTAYTSTILEDILISGACNTHLPVAGVKEFVAGDQTTTIDFGDGTCDNLAEVTVNGETETIELEGRRAYRDNHRGGRRHHRRGNHGG